MNHSRAFNYYSISFSVFFFLLNKILSMDIVLEKVNYVLATAKTKKKSNYTLNSFLASGNYCSCFLQMLVLIWIQTI